MDRCLQRHGISPLPEAEGNKPKRGKFSSYPSGYFHIDLAEVRTEQGRLNRFAAIDRTNKFAFVETRESWLEANRCLNMDERREHKKTELRKAA